MCKPGNGTIFRECRDAIFKQVGTNHVPNHEMRSLLAQQGGCFVNGVQPLPKVLLDKPLTTALR